MLLQCFSKTVTPDAVRFELRMAADILNLVEYNAIAKKMHDAFKYNEIISLRFYDRYSQEEIEATGVVLEIVTRAENGQIITKAIFEKGKPIERRVVEF